MSVRIEIIGDFKKIKELLIETYNEFNQNDIPKGLKLNRLFDWWTQYGHIDNNRFGSQKKPIILLIYKKESLSAIFPLIRVERTKKKYFRFMYVEFLSQSFNGEYLDILEILPLDSNDIINIFNFIKKEIKYDILNLSYLSVDSKLVSTFNKNVFYHSEIPILDIDLPYEEIRKKSYSRNLRSNINKFRRKIDELSDQHIIGRVLLGEDQVKEYKEKIKFVSNSKLLSPGMHSIYTSNIGDQYFNSIINRGIPYCSIYESNGHLLAYILGNVRDDGTVYYLDGAFNRHYRNEKHIGFGILALDQAIRFFSEKHKTYNLGHGKDRYKMQFTKKTIPFYQIFISGNSFIGKWYYHHRIKGLDRIK
jgi:hypothetical protein